MDKNTKKVVRAAQRRGWVFENGRVHDKLTHPSGRKVSISKSPSDGNSHRAVARDIARVEEQSGDVDGA